MINWFINDAPIRRKLAIAFAIVGAVAVTATLWTWWDERSLALEIPDAVAASRLAALARSHLLMTGVEIIALAGIGWMFNRVIATPYVTTVVRMEALAAGDLTSAVRYTANKDCVGRLTKAMSTFKNAAVEREALQRAAAGHQDDMAAKLRALQDDFAMRSEDQKTVVEALAAGLDALARGNLTVRIGSAVAADYRKLRDDFNAAATALQNAIGTISTNIAGIGGSVEAIAQATDDLSRRTEQQAASLAESSAALNEITAAVRVTADGAEHAREVVTTAKADAEQSGTVMRMAVAAMGGIEQSSRQISQIIGVIDEIAFQTNLLALNAGVEAARAGESGRGFAVVASEVRGLAQRSAEAAKEIKALISAAARQVGEGVGLVGQTEKSLTRISHHVAEISTVVAEIAASAQQQATGLREVNLAVTQMDKATQQNAAMVEETTAASRTLATEADELIRLTKQFALGSATDHVPSGGSGQATAWEASQPRARMKVVAGATASRHG